MYQLYFSVYSRLSCIDANMQYTDTDFRFRDSYRSFAHDFAHYVLFSMATSVRCNVSAAERLVLVGLRGIPTALEALAVQLLKVTSITFAAQEVGVRKAGCKHACSV